VEPAKQFVLSALEEQREEDRDRGVPGANTRCYLLAANYYADWGDRLKGLSLHDAFHCPNEGSCA
jgi:hypothetical protein